MTNRALAMVYIASLVICALLVLLGVNLIVVPAAGLPQGEAGMPTAVLPLVCSLCIFIGIVSSILFDRFDKRFRPRQSVFRASDLIVASVLSPIVFLAFYPLLQQTTDSIIAVLLAYQNGFLFQNIVARVRGGSTQRT